MSDEKLDRVHDNAEHALDALHDGDVSAAVAALEQIKRLSR